MWLTIVLDALKYLPYVAAGINAIHGDAVAHETKTQMAMDALGISSAIAKGVIPKESAVVSGVAQLVGAGITESAQLVSAAQGKGSADPQPVTVSPSASAIIEAIGEQSGLAPA